MFEYLMSKDHAIALLKKDHDEVKVMFDEFKKAESSAAKEKIIGRAITALKLHAAVEEELFYPTVRREVGAEIMNEADEEHHVARLLIAELDSPEGGGDHRFAKFTVLAENIQHHIKEEESMMMPKAAEAKVDFRALGDMMQARKAKLLRDGIPPDREHKLMGKIRGSADTPAAAAKMKKPKIRKVAVPPTLENGRDLRT